MTLRQLEMEAGWMGKLKAEDDHRLHLIAAILILGA